MKSNAAKVDWERVNEVLDNLKTISNYSGKSLSGLDLKFGAQLLRALEPRWQFIAYEVKAGESVGLRAHDPDLDCILYVKIALPAMQRGGGKAIKIFSPSSWQNLFSNAFRDRYLRGSRIQFKLNIYLNKPFIRRYGIVPHVLRISELPLFTAMEYVDATPSMEWVKNKPFPEIMQIFRRLLLFVYHNLHRFSIVHRDLKPGNILIMEPGWPVILDFTTAKDLTMSDNITAIGEAVGTPMYFSPQQRANARSTTYTDEVYALGRLMFMWFQRRESVDTDVGALPDPLRPVYEKATAVVPEDRYQTVKPFLEDLGVVFDEMGVPKIDIPRAPGVAGAITKKLERPKSARTQMDLESIPEIVRLFWAAVWGAEDIRKDL